MAHLSGHVQARRKLRNISTILLITHHIPGTGIVGMPPFPGSEKKIEFSPFAKGVVVIGATEFWLNRKFHEFFEYLS